MNISQTLKEILKDTKVSMYRISKESGIPHASFSKLVRGDHKEVTLGMINKIGEGLAKIQPKYKYYFFVLLHMNEEPIEIPYDEGFSVEIPDYAMVREILDAAFEIGKFDNKPLQKKREEFNSKNGMEKPYTFEFFVAAKYAQQKSVTMRQEFESGIIEENKDEEILTETINIRLPKVI